MNFCQRIHRQDKRVSEHVLVTGDPPPALLMLRCFALTRKASVFIVRGGSIWLNSLRGYLTLFYIPN
jgi:hypothetical protein